MLILKIQNSSEPIETTEGSGPTEIKNKIKQTETHDNESTGIKFNVGHLDDIKKKIDFSSNTRLNSLNMGIVGDLGQEKQLTRGYNLVKDQTKTVKRF